MTPELQTRHELASVYRLMSRFGWDDLMFGHATARIPGTDLILMNQWGLAFHEITPENLVPVTMTGQVMGNQAINPAGFVIHGAIHQAMPQIGAVIHTHSKNGIAVSADSRGLLPLSQISVSVLDDLVYHDYQGIFIDTDEQASLIADLGNKRSMIMRNHGLLTLGNSIHEAMFRMYMLQSACDIQVLCGHGNIRLIAPEVLESHKKRQSSLNSQVDWNAAWQLMLRLANDK